MCETIYGAYTKPGVMISWPLNTTQVLMIEQQLIDFGDPSKTH